METLSSVMIGATALLRVWIDGQEVCSVGRVRGDKKRGISYLQDALGDFVGTIE